MRKCPKCGFENEDAFPTCVWCNTSLGQVPSIVPEDPAHRDYQRSAANAQRSRALGKKYRFAGVFYAVVIALTAMLPGLVFQVEALACYFVSGALVAVGANAGILGQFSGGLVQGMLSLGLIFYYGPISPFTFFMLAMHIILAGFMWHWLIMIADTHR